MKMRKLTKMVLVAGLLVAMGGYPMQASAIPYSQSSGFNVAAGTLASTDGTTPYNDIKWYSDGSTPVDEPTGYYNTIAWGAGNNNNAGLMASDPFGAFGNTGNYLTAYSGLKVVGLDGNIFAGTNGSFGNAVAISTVFHQNNTITSLTESLASASVYSELTVGTTNANAIPITFWETPNGGACPYNLGVPCADKWSFALSGFAPVSFTYEDVQYTAIFGLGNLQNMTPGGAAPEIQYTQDGAIIWTAEKSTSALDVMMRIKVPEPGTLLLLGLGLVGLAGARRRIKK